MNRKVKNRASYFGSFHFNILIGLTLLYYFHMKTTSKLFLTFVDGKHELEELSTVKFILKTSPVKSYNTFHTVHPGRDARENSQSDKSAPDG